MWHSWANTRHDTNSTDKTFELCFESLQNMLVKWNYMRCNKGCCTQHRTRVHACWLDTRWVQEQAFTLWFLVSMWCLQCCCQDVDKDSCMPALCIRSEQYFLLEVVDRTGTVTLNMYISETHVHLAPAANFLAIKKERAPLLWAKILNFWWHSRILKVEIRKRRFPRFPFLWYVNTIIFALSLCVLSNSAKWSTLSRAIISWLTQHLAICCECCLPSLQNLNKQPILRSSIHSWCRHVDWHFYQVR